MRDEGTFETVYVDAAADSDGLEHERYCFSKRKRGRKRRDVEVCVQGDEGAGGVERGCSKYLEQ